MTTSEENIKYLAAFSPWTSSHLQDIYQAVMTKLPPKQGDKVLDVGCGSGELGHFLLSKFPNLDLTSSDILPEAGQFADGKFVCCSITDMPFPDETFDIVYCMHVIAHIEDRKKAIAECMRVLKKGGKLMVFTPNKYYVWACKAASRLHIIPRYKFNDTARWMFTRRSLERLLGAPVEYMRKPPRQLPFQIFREKLIAVVEKK